MADDYYTTQNMRQLYLAGVAPHSIGIKWRNDPPPFSSPDWQSECMKAVLDCLTAEGVVAWPGDATSCVCQIIEAYARRAHSGEVKS